MIFHIVSREAWLAALQRGEYRAPSLDREGFIHCSTITQVIPVANAFYRGQSDLVLLVIDETQVEPEIRWEAPAGPPADGVSLSDLFPHVYGALNLDAVLQVVDFKPDGAGTFSLPPLPTEN